MDGKDRIIINIEARHTTYGDEHTITESYEGTYHIKNETHYIMYESFEGDNKDKVSNIIKINGDNMQITKRGKAKSTMIFSKGNKHRSDYVTPYGTFAIETDTNDLKFINSDESITIALDYSLYLNNEHSSDCVMKIILR